MPKNINLTEKPKEHFVEAYFCNTTDQRLSPDIRITRNPDLPAHFGTRIPDTPNPGKRMYDEHYFKAFFGSFLQRNAKKLILGPHYVSPSCTSFIGTIKIHQHFNDWKNFAFQ